MISSTWSRDLLFHYLKRILVCKLHTFFSSYQTYYVQTSTSQLAWRLIFQKKSCTTGSDSKEGHVTLFIEEMKVLNIYKLKLGAFSQKLKLAKVTPVF